jgi:hypothetical protein
MAPPITFASFLASIAPTEWRGDNAAAYLERRGEMADAVALQATHAVRAGWPSTTYADASTLVYQGAERLIARGLVESDATYAERIRKSWEVWPWVGTSYGVLKALEGAGYNSTNGNPYVIQQNGLAYSLDGTGATDGSDVVIEDVGGNPVIGDAPWWEVDSYDDLGFDFWSRFVVLFPDLPTGWVDPGITSPPTGVSTPTTSEVNSLIRLVNQWKRQVATFAGVIVLLGAGPWWGWPLGQTWGGGGVWGGTDSIIWDGTEY